MLNHAILWSYSSVWKAPVTGIRLTIESLENLSFSPEDVIVERDAYELVKCKAQVGASPQWWTKSHDSGWC